MSAPYRCTGIYSLSPQLTHLLAGDGPGVKLDCCYIHLGAPIGSRYLSIPPYHQETMTKWERRRTILAQHFLGLVGSQSSTYHGARSVRNMRSARRRASMSDDMTRPARASAENDVPPRYTAARSATDRCRSGGLSEEVQDRAAVFQFQVVHSVVPVAEVVGDLEGKCSRDVVLSRFEGSFDVY